MTGNPRWKMGCIHPFADCPQFNVMKMIHSQRGVPKWAVALYEIELHSKRLMHLTFFKWPNDLTTHHFIIYTVFGVCLYVCSIYGHFDIFPDILSWTRLWDAIFIVTIFLFIIFYMNEAFKSFIIWSTQMSSMCPISNRLFFILTFADK